MVSVIIPTLNAGPTLAATLGALIPAVVDGTVREVIVADGGSNDSTLAIAEDSGCRIVRGDAGRGTQLAAGAAAARHDWLLFLHADTRLETDWHRETEAFIQSVETGARSDTAAAFRFALDASGLRPRVIEAGVSLRCRLCAMPYGDQGLLISRQLYDEIDGFKQIPLFEDVDIVRRIGRRRIALLRSNATTSAARYSDGYAARVMRNCRCVLLYYLGASPQRLEKIYNG